MEQAEEEAGPWQSLSDLSLRSLFGARALPLASESEPSLAGSGLNGSAREGEDGHDSAQHSARAAAVALRSHAYGQQQLKRIMLLNSLVYGLIMARDWLAAQVHGRKGVSGCTTAACVGPLSLAYRSAWTFILCAITAAVAWSVRTQSPQTGKQAVARSRLLFRAILFDLSLGPHNNAALLEYVQKPAQECGGAGTVAACIVQRYWPSTHLAYGLVKSTYGYPVQLIFFPELVRSVLFVVCSLLAVRMYDGPAAASDTFLILSLCSRAAMSFCITLFMSPTDTAYWRDLDRAGLRRQDLLNATCPPPLRSLRDGLSASFTAAARWTRHAAGMSYFPKGLEPIERWLSAAACGPVLCILVGSHSLYNIGRMQVQMYFVAQFLAMAYNSLFPTHLQRVPSEPSLGHSAAALGAVQPMLEWTSLTSTDKVLGMGAAATVVEARLKGSTVAVKCWLDDAIALGTSEAAILMSLRHPNILTVFGVLKDPPALVTERGHCSLQALLSDPSRAATLTWPARVILLRGIACACDFLHAHSPPIIHGDLKTSNIIIAFDGTPKLADFGSSYIVAGVPCPHEGFSINFAAPEVLRLLPISEPTAVDVYSFGIVCLHVCDTTTTRKAALTNRRSSTLRSGASVMTWRPAVVPASWPPPVRALILQCTREAPAERCTFKELVGDLLQLEKESYSWEKGSSQPDAAKKDS